MKRFLVALCLFVVSCGPPTVQGAESRYKSNVDKISAIMTRKPESKATLDAKLAEFKAEYEVAMKETNDEKKISALSSLSSRMEIFISDVEPKDAKAGGVAAPSDKLDKKGAAAPGATPGATPTAPGGKLDGPGGSGMGGSPTATPTPTPTPGTPTPTATPTPAATPPATAPSSGGGMGGM
jgi:hypothetical protein